MLTFRRVLLVLFGLATFAAAALAATRPGAATCLSIAYRDLDRLPDGTFVEQTVSTAQRQRVSALRREATGRINAFVGAAVARPVVVVLDDPAALWPIQFNRHASTVFGGTRACVVVGPEGRSLDVLAHELMHAEVFERVGPWRKAMAVPTWFDEGLAMQLDHRAKYDAGPQDTATDSVRSLASASAFFAGTDAELTAHYAFAKVEVSRWVARIGPGDIATRLARLKAGTDFHCVWSD